MFSRRRHPPEAGLHECPLCHDDFVVPVKAEALELGRWDLRLRCGQCETYRDVVVSDGDAKRYDLDLERGMSEIAEALRREDRRRGEGLHRGARARPDRRRGLRLPLSRLLAHDAEAGTRADRGGRTIAQ